MKPINELNFGYNDAENYRKKENKEVFNRYFTRTEDLEKVLQRDKYFLIGDKGTGKTALSVYLANNDFLNTISALKFIRETDYQKFIYLKKEKHLSLSDYTDIWKVIILLLVAKQIETQEKNNSIFSSAKFSMLKEAINSFYHNAFSPEIINAIQFVEDSKRAVKILSEHLNAEFGKDKKITESESKFQINLLVIKKHFEEAIRSLSLSKNLILFIDGIDIRPKDIYYNEYLECVKGLANAVWTLNNDFFANIKDSKGVIKVVMLVRPDIFAALGLQNLNNKIKDNSVLLDWRTIYPKYRNSNIFSLIDNILNYQQNNRHPVGTSWDYYFPFKSVAANKEEDSFIPFLRYSMCKPRDIISILSILQEIHSKKSIAFPFFTSAEFNDTDFRIRYSDYLLGEIKDYLAFYHSDMDYELFIKFFEFLDGKSSFTYDDFIVSYNKFADYIEKNWQEQTPIFFESSDKFLQFLFELNIICYVAKNEDGENLLHWCYRERSYSNLNPKVRFGELYQIHYGLVKAFNVGKNKLKIRTINK